MNGDKYSWPVMIVSDMFYDKEDKGYRLNQLVECLKTDHECKVIECLSYEDALETFLSRADFGAVILDWDMKSESGKLDAKRLLCDIRRRNEQIPVFMLTDKVRADSLDSDTLNKLTGSLWKTSDTIEFLAGNVDRFLLEYVESVYPPFFGALVEYADRFKYAWHTPGHMGGTGFLRTPSGSAFFKFFGENTLRSDLSISVPELGSLLDHSGITGDAERNSAKVFGADQTYYVLNGTSNVNQIIWRSQVMPDDIAFVDRNCHKSLNYGMVITEAFPVYMIPRRNKMGIIGPVMLKEFDSKFIRSKIKQNALIPADKKNNTVKMSALTNSTYDGVCYNVITIKKILEKSVENLHFDEAWYAYARFSPMYKNHFGMADDVLKDNHPPIFVSHSTHKLLTAFSQSSMLHIKNGGKVKIEPSEFNESYMMHGSTSPQYSMVASLDVATKMMQDHGEQVWRDTIALAIEFRKGIARIKKQLAKKKDWFFGMWQPETVVDEKGKKVAFETASTEYLAETQAPWVMSEDNNWHGFEKIEKDYVMLDPIKLTITTPGFYIGGKMPDFGIPASIVTNYLINEGIVCEKTDYYSFLMLNSLGTNKAKQESLLMGLMRFKKLYDENAPMSEIFPDIVAASPETYGKKGLKDHCQEMHEFIRKNGMLDKMQEAFEVIPDQVMKPADAYRHVVGKNVEFVPLSEMMGRIPSVMVVPYPPGIPIIMGGEIFNPKAKPIFDYLRLRENFEQVFPGYESDIHGVERFEKDGKKYFKTLCVKK